MSFDLFFYTAPGAATRLTSAATGEAVAAVLGRDATPTQTASGTEWACTGADTGVTFTLRHRDPATSELPAAIVSSDSAGAPFSGFSVEVAYVRPKFFGIEALASAGAIAGRLGLLMPDPLSPPKSGQPVNVVKTEPAAMNQIIEHWMAGNRFAIASTQKLTGKRPPYLESERSMHWWRFQRMRQSLQKAMGQNAIVSQARVIRVVSTGELVLMADWANGFPAVFPQVEVFLMIDAKSLDDPNAKVAWTPAGEVIDKLGAAFRRFEQPGCDLMACAGIPPNSPLRAAFDALPRYPVQGMIEDIGLAFIDEPEQPAATA